MQWQVAVWNLHFLVLGTLKPSLSIRESLISPYSIPPQSLPLQSLSLSSPVVSWIIDAGTNKAAVRKDRFTDRVDNPFS